MFQSQTTCLHSYCSSLGNIIIHPGTHTYTYMYTYICTNLYLSSSGDAGLVGFLDTAIDILHHLLIFPGLSHWSRWKWVDLQLTCTCSVSCYYACLPGLWLDELLHLSVLSTLILKASVLCTCISLCSVCRSSGYTYRAQRE